MITLPRTECWKYVLKKKQKTNVETCETSETSAGLEWWELATSNDPAFLELSTLWNNSAWGQKPQDISLLKGAGPVLTGNQIVLRANSKNMFKKVSVATEERSKCRSKWPGPLLSGGQVHLSRSQSFAKKNKAQGECRTFFYFSTSKKDTGKPPQNLTCRKGSSPQPTFEGLF